MSLSSDFELGHVNCLSQWNVGESDSVSYKLNL